MKLLILGGTTFLGRHIVEQALLEGHRVTLFNRGRTNPELFADQVEKIIGDRMQDLDRVADRRFDACIDTSGYLPGALEIAGRALKDSVDRYVFISSISVYAEFTRNMDESAATAQLPANADPTEYDLSNYGPLKALSEQAIEELMPGRVLHVRSGLIVGPFDPTNRFTYWPARMARGGNMLAPVGPDFPVQVIHAADQALWILHMLGTDRMGVFNVTSDDGAYTFGDLIEAGKRAIGTDIDPIWIPGDFLAGEGVQPWMELPLWLPDDMVDMSRVSARKAYRAGLTLRSLEDTVRSTLDWYRQQPEQQWPAGLAAEKEQAVLEAWQTHQNSNQ